MLSGLCALIKPGIWLIWNGLRWPRGSAASGAIGLCICFAAGGCGPQAENGLRRVQVADGTTKGVQERVVCYVDSDELAELQITESQVRDAIQAILAMPAEAIAQVLIDQFGNQRPANEPGPQAEPESPAAELAPSMKELLRRGIFIEILEITADGERVVLRDVFTYPLPSTPRRE